AIGDEAVGGDNVDIYYSMALAHEANRRPREALAVYQKILSFDYSFKDAMPRMKALEDKPRVGPARGSQGPHDAGVGRAEAYRYQVEQALGAGKLGEVFRGVDTALGRKVAIRRIREGPNEAGKAERILKEAAKAVQLSHENIVSIYDTAADENGRFIVTA